MLFDYDKVVVGLSIEHMPKLHDEENHLLTKPVRMKFPSISVEIETTVGNFNFD